MSGAYEGRIPAGRSGFRSGKVDPVPDWAKWAAAHRQPSFPDLLTDHRSSSSLLNMSTDIEQEIRVLESVLEERRRVQRVRDEATFRAERNDVWVDLPESRPSLTVQSRTAAQGPHR